MWWSFVGRTGEEIVAVRNTWVAGEFGQVVGYAGDPLPASALPPGSRSARQPRSHKDGYAE
jgi:quercetin 2,3-dioxygenase